MFAYLRGAAVDGHSVELTSLSPSGCARARAALAEGQDGGVRGELHCEEDGRGGGVGICEEGEDERSGDVPAEVSLAGGATIVPGLAPGSEGGPAMPEGVDPASAERGEGCIAASCRDSAACRKDSDVEVSKPLRGMHSPRRYSLLGLHPPATGIASCDEVEPTLPSTLP